MIKSAEVSFQRVAACVCPSCDQEIALLFPDVAESPIVGTPVDKEPSYPDHWVLQRPYPENKIHIFPGKPNYSFCRSAYFYQSVDYEPVISLTDEGICKHCIRIATKKITS